MTDSHTVARVRRGLHDPEPANDDNPAGFCRAIAAILAMWAVVGLAAWLLW
jgi:hypothetical protein